MEKIKMPYVIVRTNSAGVFAGELEKKTTNIAGFFECILRKSRRIWYWDGAASLSQLATDGTSKPENCKFPCEVDREELAQGIEIITVTDKAMASIKGVPIWKK